VKKSIASMIQAHRSYLAPYATYTIERILHVDTPV